jgi:Acetyltransferase (GNAT) domain
LQQAEAEAQKQGAIHLHCEASLNAEGFYARHGFEVTERTIYRMSSGVEAPSVMMRKRFSAS